MSLNKKIIYVVSFFVSSLILGAVSSFVIGMYLPERDSLMTSKSFQVPKMMIWDALLDFESYPLWKPGVKRIEMLGQNEDGYTRWREYYPTGRQATFEVSEIIPRESIEVVVVESKRTAKGTWIYRCTQYDDAGILMVKRFAIVSNPIERFIRRYIDSKYSEADLFVMSLNRYLIQLSEDQDEVDKIEQGMSQSKFSSEVQKTLEVPSDEESLTSEIVIEDDDDEVIVAE